jgi:hypothetical protein
MKKLWITGFAAGCLLVLGSCDEDNKQVTTPTCTLKTTTADAGINFFDLNPFSQYYNQAVANFRFHQESGSYTGTIACPPMECTTTLVIFNATNRRMRFDYQVSFRYNAASWTYQGIATIPAGGSFDAGKISSSCTGIASDRFLIQSGKITYE